MHNSMPNINAPPYLEFAGVIATPDGWTKSEATPPLLRNAAGNTLDLAISVRKPPRRPSRLSGTLSAHHGPPFIADYVSLGADDFPGSQVGRPGRAGSSLRVRSFNLRE